MDSYQLTLYMLHTQREEGAATVEGSLSRLVSAFLSWGQNFKFVK